MAAFLSSAFIRLKTKLGYAPQCHKKLSYPPSSSFGSSSLFTSKFDWEFSVLSEMCLLISATDRHRQSTDHPIKFIFRRQPHTLKFKIKPGLEADIIDGRTKRISSFLFHPFLPLAISIQQTLFLQKSVVNIHFRR